ncbi:MAG: hypothetical protein F6K17_08045 [Okeania sp. SIO3C4]|nr:hypothetical protein [Okeania sp. SIO3C4]
MTQQARFMTAASLRFAAALLACAVMLLEAAAQQASELRAVRFGVAGAGKTRIVFDVKGAPDYAIKGDGAGAGRLFVEFANLASVHPDARAVKGRGLIKSATYDPNARAAARVALPLTRPAKIDGAFVIPPSSGNELHRLVIDVSAADKVAFFASLGLAAPPEKSATRQGKAPKAGTKSASTPAPSPKRQTAQLEPDAADNISNIKIFCI